MNEKRLLKLAAVLKTVPAKHFDMGHWAGGEYDEEGVQLEAGKSLFGAKGQGTPKTCGTTACAMGWACTIPEFKSAGLKMRGFNPTFRGEHSFRAAAEFFDLTPYEVDYLFGAENERTPKQEAAVILKFVAERKKIDQLQKAYDAAQEKADDLCSELDNLENKLTRQ